MARPDGFLRALISLTNERSRKYMDWSPVRWQADGMAVAARMWRFAGGWVAVSDAVEAVYLAAVGVGTDPEGLSLAVLDNGDTCHFDLVQPLHSRVMAASHAARIDGDQPPPKPGDWHADQLHFMR